MTKQERVVVSAYTGYLMCDWNDVHKYVEEKVGRSVWTHEFADLEFQKEVQKVTRPDFLALCVKEDN